MKTQNTLTELICAHSRALHELAARHGVTSPKVREVMGLHNRAIARLCNAAKKGN